MDRVEYKNLCRRSHVLDRLTLELTARALRKAGPAVATHLARILAGGPIPRPPLQRGDSVDDFFETNLSPEEVQTIVRILASVEAAGIEIQQGWAGGVADVARVLMRWQRLASSK